MNFVVDPTRGSSSPHVRADREVDSGRDGGFDDALARAGSSEATPTTTRPNEVRPRPSELRAAEPSSRDRVGAARGAAAKPRESAAPSTRDVLAETSGTEEEPEPRDAERSTEASTTGPNEPAVGAFGPLPGTEARASGGEGEGSDADVEASTELRPNEPAAVGSSSTELPAWPQAVPSDVRIPSASSSNAATRHAGQAPSLFATNRAGTSPKSLARREAAAVARAPSDGRGSVDPAAGSWAGSDTAPHRPMPTAESRPPSVGTSADASASNPRDANSASNPDASRGFTITARGYDVAPDPAGLRPDALLRDLIARADRPELSTVAPARDGDAEVARGAELRVESTKTRASNREASEHELGDSSRQGRSSHEAQIEPSAFDAVAVGSDGSGVGATSPQGVVAQPVDASAFEAAPNATREASLATDARLLERQEAVELDVNRLTLRHGLRATADLGDLGRVEVDARFSGGIVDLGLRAVEGETRALLNASRSQLQVELESSSEFERTRLRVGRLEIAALPEDAPRAALPPIDPPHAPRGSTDQALRDGSASAYGETPTDRRGSNPSHADSRRDDAQEGRVHATQAAPPVAPSRALDLRNTASAGRVRIVL
jgi:hypothetical protein